MRCAAPKIVVRVCSTLPKPVVCIKRGGRQKNCGGFLGFLHLAVIAMRTAPCFGILATFGVKCHVCDNFKITTFRLINSNGSKEVRSKGPQRLPEPPAVRFGHYITSITTAGNYGSGEARLKPNQSRQPRPGLRISKAIAI